MFDDINFKLFVEPIKLNLGFENVFYKVKDSYADKWGDIYDEDNVTEALTHAKQELEFLNRVGASIRIVYLNRACNDLKNYLIAANELAIKYLNNNNKYLNYEKVIKIWDRDAKRLIESIAAYKIKDVDSAVCKIIRDTLSYVKKQHSRASFIPDYKELFQRIGDSALFLDGDLERALIWYSLLPIYWEEYEDIDDSLLGKDEIEIKNQNRWWRCFLKAIESIRTLPDGYNFTDSIMGVAGLAEEISPSSKEMLWNYLSAWDGIIELECSDYDNIWNLAQEFTREVEMELRSALDFGHESLKKYRAEIAIAYIINKQATICHVFSLARANDGEKLTAEENSMIISAIQSDESNKLQPLRFYINAKKAAQKNSPVSDLALRAIYLFKAVSYCDDVLNVLKETNYSGRLAYYSELNTLKKMLPSTAETIDNIGKLAVMHVAYMNDPNEGKALKQWIFEKKDDINDVGRVKADYPYEFIKCFTTRIDDLPMWEMYGDRARGCCVVVDLKYSFLSRGFPLYNVCYIKKTRDMSYDVEDIDNQVITVPNGIKIIKESVNNMIDIRKKWGKDKLFLAALDRIISRIAYLFKNADYSYEREKRIVYSLASGIDDRIKITKTTRNSEIPKLYVISDKQLLIDEVILGPKFLDASNTIPYLQLELEKMCREIGTRRNVRISHSTIEYK